MWFLLIILVISVLLVLIRNRYHYWEYKNIPFDKPSIPFGSLDALRRKERSFGLIMYDIYVRSKEQIVGIYLLYRPAILVRDAHIVRQMMTTDFVSFHDRGLFVDKEPNLFSMEGQAWKNLRAKLVPSFTSGKLKGMFGTIDEVGDKMVEHLNKVLDGNGGSQKVEMKSVLTTYAIDIIGSVIFGLDIDSFSNPDNEFRVISSNIFQNSGIIDSIRLASSFICPPVAKFLAFLGVQDKSKEAMERIIRRTIEFREKNNVVRKDLLQLLIQLRNTGKISEDDDEVWKVETAAEELKSMSIEMIAAQAFLFYIAGSETTAATSAFSLYELAMYPNLLKKAQQDVAESLEKHSLKPTDKFTYEAMTDMKFLDLCIKETTRKYPGLPFLNRQCTQDYEIPGTNYTIEKGTPILISLFGLHRDPEYFPSPMKYDPERFLEENRNYNPVAYMPFGEGPRHCVAQRMGQISTKVAVAKILANFNVETMEHKELEFVYDHTPVLMPKGGLNVCLSKKSNL